MLAKDPIIRAGKKKVGQMGVWKSDAPVAEAEELRKVILRCIGDGGNSQKSGPDGVRRGSEGRGGEWSEDGRTVCVTGGFSFVGFALVDRLLGRGYTVRLLVESQEDLDKLSEMEILEMDGLRPVMANAFDVDSLCRAFDACAGVFHTCTSLDPGGISGYSKHMADIEVRAAERVIEACVRTKSVRKCVFSSSLLACIWPLQSDRRPNDIVDESCWSDETTCRNKKLWYALGKTMAETAAWRVARGSALNLVTVCPALVTGPGFHRRNSTASIAYLKGADEMFSQGLLAAVDVATLADAQVSIYEAITSNSASGRYICYDHVIQTSEEINELEQQLAMPMRMSGEAQTIRPPSSELSNRKLFRLMNPTGRRCTYDVYTPRPT